MRLSSVCLLQQTSRLYSIAGVFNIFIKLSIPYLYLSFPFDIMSLKLKMIDSRTFLKKKNSLYLSLSVNSANILCPNSLNKYIRLKIYIVRYFHTVLGLYSKSVRYTSRPYTFFNSPQLYSKLLSFHILISFCSVYVTINIYIHF